MNRTHPFSTPDGNKTYCRTCGCTREAGNHGVFAPLTEAELDELSERLMSGGHRLGIAELGLAAWEENVRP